MSTDRDARMKLWAGFKLDYRNSGGRNWKAQKKAIKRQRRDFRFGFGMIPA